MLEFAEQRDFLPLSTLIRVYPIPNHPRHPRHRLVHYEKDIEEFERAAQSINEQIKTFAEKTLPTSRERLQQAQQLQQTVATRK